jgi:adenine-specific DNA-methyltransferase
LKPIKKTLRPVKEDSVDWDNTQNLYIEGDNLEVLKLLQKSYLGKVKMIYIDPPYNTGNDFVYHDDFAMSADEYAEASGSVDELGNKYIKNMDSNGRFHSDWCSMMYSRLMVARTLLTEDGVIFISIDDNEVENLRKICDEVFGESNKIAQLVIENNPRGRQSDAFFATSHEYLLCYAGNIDSATINGMSLSEKQKAEYKYEDEIGRYRLLGLRQRGVASLREDRPEMFFPIWVNPEDSSISLTYVEDWEEVIPKKSDGREGRWMWGKQKCINESNRLVAKLVSTRREFDIFVKDYLNKDGEQRTRKYKTIWSDKILNNQIGTQEVKAILGGDYMSFPKSTEYIKTIIQTGTSSSSLILDFFSGSATTAHAVMQLNAEDGGNRQYIMVQLPEETPEDSEARKAGYNTIPDIAKERIRRAGKKIKEESPLTTADLDTGFRVFRLDEGNYEDVKRSPKEFKQDQLDLFLNNIKADRNDLDLLFGCMLDWGVQLSLPMTQEVVDGKTIYTVNDGDLVVCFAENVSEDVVKAMAEKMPLRVIFRDSCFAQDADKINIYETFKQKLDWSDQEVVKNIRVI